MNDEIRCIAPSTTPRFKGDRCNWFLTRPRIGERLHIVGLVGHSSLADPSHALYACGKCGHLHEVRVEVVERLASAA